MGFVYRLLNNFLMEFLLYPAAVLWIGYILCVCVCVGGPEQGSAECRQRVACTVADYYEYQSKCDRYNQVVFPFHFYVFSFSCLKYRDIFWHVKHILLTDVLSYSILPIIVLWPWPWVNLRPRRHIVPGRKHSLVYLEPTERVWWLQMSSYLC